MKTRHLFLFIILLGLNISICAQENLTENPRGVYKFMDFVGRGKKTFEATEDVYKICTDSMTLTLNVKDSEFELKYFDGDRIFDYTGEEPDVYDPKFSRIYDSNSQKFTVKWWSEGYIDRPLFPTDDWCIEHYEANKFSEKGKGIVEAFMSPDYRDETNPLIGVWHPLGSVMNLQDTTLVDSILKTAGKNMNAQSYCILTPSMLLNSNIEKGSITPIRITCQDSIQINDKLRTVTWLSLDTIAIALQRGYTIWGRDVGGRALIARISVPISSDPFFKYIKRNTEWGELLAIDKATLIDKCTKLIKSKKIHDMYTGGSMAHDLASHYVQQNLLMNDLVKLFEERIPYQFVRILNTMYDTPKARVASAHLKLVKEEMDLSMLETLKIAAETGSIPTIPTEKICPDTYKEVFMQYYSATHIEDIMMRRMEGIVNKLDTKDQKNVKKQMPDIRDFMRQQMSVRLRNICIGIMTEEDLTTLVSIVTSKEGKIASEENMAFLKMVNEWLCTQERNEIAVKMEEKVIKFAEQNTYVTHETRWIQR